MPTADFLKNNLDRLFDSGKAERLLRLLVTLSMVLLVARTSADLTWQLTTPLLNKGRTAETSSITSQSRPRPQLPLGQTAPVEEIALFGMAPGILPPAAGSSAEAAPTTNLNLVLKGIVAVIPMRRALAIIAERGGATEQLYGQGEELPGNAIIREIHATKVIISRAGVLETLYLEGTLSQTANRGTVPPTTRTASTLDNIRPRGDGTNWQINQDYWQERLADVPGLAREIGVEIYKENNQQKGYRLVSGQNSKLLNDLGLQAGDILLSVNGLAMNSVQEGLTAYQQIKTGGQITIEINRNGRHETRSYHIGG